jgi:hypothetical protein
VEHDIERQRVEEVFGLTGGELNDRPWEPFEPDTDGSAFTRVSFAYSYDGAPSYAEEYRGGRRAGDHECVVVQDCLFGELPAVLYEKGRRYDRVAVLRSSGETECPCNDTDEQAHRQAAAKLDPDERAALGVKVEPCPLCEDDGTDETPHIYLGDGWCETVYRVTETCGACGGDLTVAPDYHDDPRCLACEPYAFTVTAEGAEAYGSGVVYEGADPKAAETAYETWRARCDTVLSLDGEPIREDTAYERERSVKALGKDLVSRAESYGGEIDYAAFHAFVAETRKPWDDLSGALNYWWGYCEAATTGPRSRVEIKHYFNGKLVLSGRFPQKLEDGSVIPAGGYARVVSVYLWAVTGKIKDWLVGAPGVYTLPDGRSFVAEEVTDERGYKSVRTTRVLPAE